MSDIKKLHVFGSYGEFDVDVETGVPTGHENIEEYNDITKVDVAEYFEWLAQTGNSKDVENVDIIALAFWGADKDGKDTYFEPDSTWRRRMLEGWPGPVLMNTEAVKGLGFASE